MKVTNLKDLSKEKYQTIIYRSVGNSQNIIPMVRKTMENVQRSGDKVLYKKGITRFGKDNYKSIKVTKKEIKMAYSNVDSRFIQSIKLMIKNITKVHEVQLPTKKDTIVEPLEGIKVWREWRPIEKVGLYIPGGKAVYPSSVLMSVIPAQLAGCTEIVMCSPPRGTGGVPAPTLVAADMVGLKKIYKIGGIEAIAAMTYGTKIIPKVHKIFGAGNSYITAAKIIALETVSIDMPAGPSEIFIIADETANPAFIAADLLADGEHGEDSACVLITTSLEVGQKTIIEINKQLKNIYTRDRVIKSMGKYGLIGLVENINEAIDFTNKYAPEHLELMVKNPEKILNKILNAGSVFLGNWTSKSAGDYATGANHILPTGGMAKMYPPLGIDAFGKWMQVQKCTKTGLKNIKQTVETISEVEQLPAHKNATSIRFL